MTSSIKSSCFHNQSLEAETEKSLATINRKILEIKKKIQLSEGQRKAYYEENNHILKQNADRVNKLKKEIKVLSEELAKAKTDLGGEKEFRLVKYLHELGPIGNKDHNQLKELLDLKVIDLHKQLDLIRYSRKSKKGELAKLERDYQTLISEKSGENRRRKNSSAITQLENDIHRIAIQWMEAEHIRKKYSGIRHSLLYDSVKFESALNKVERLIRQQNEEIKKLQEINRSAMCMRDNTMSALLQLEAQTTEASSVREKQLITFRSKVDERKAELERLERKIFPTARPILVQQDSTGSGELAVVEEENGSSLGGVNMDDIFQKLMRTTGVNDPEEVFGKFKAQKTTTERLLYLKNNTEEEKKHLESDQNLMIAELESHKFAQIKDKEENLEATESLKKKIEEMVEREKEYEIETNKISSILINIKKTYYDCCLKLEDVDNTAIPEWTDDTKNLEEICNMFKTKFLTALELLKKEKAVSDYLTPKTGEERRKSRDVSIIEKVPSEERGQLPSAYQELLAPRTKSRGAGTPSGNTSKPAGVSDEEEEIPSRGFLKRQAQLIVDTKSRRKGYKIPQMIKK